MSYDEEMELWERASIEDFLEFEKGLKMVEITKIVVRIGDKQAELTLEQARELRKALDDLLGSGVVWISSPWWSYPYYPVITSGDSTGQYIITVS